jgi:hypothetical protein
MVDPLQNRCCCKQLERAAHQKPLFWTMFNSPIGCGFDCHDADARPGLSFDLGDLTFCLQIGGFD